MGDGGDGTGVGLVDKKKLRSPSRLSAGLRARVAGGMLVKASNVTHNSNKFAVYDKVYKVIPRVISVNRRSGNPK